MHGNNGSIDGDGAAAMRYTECRLSRFGQTMIENIDKNTVELINNFDDSEKEPTVLPTLLPNLLINGASGIAAGYATNIPTFNFNEVVDAIITRIDSPNCQLKSIMQVMPGPDFPTGGIILNRDGILDAYKTGKGKITIRGKIELLNAKTALITSIPYETNKSAIIKQIDMLSEKFDVCNISEVRDEISKVAGIAEANDEVVADEIASDDDIAKTSDEISEISEVSDEIVTDEVAKTSDEVASGDDEFAGISESDLAGALGLDIAGLSSEQEKPKEQKNNADIEQAKSQISSQITETIGATLASSPALKEAIKGMKIKINISFEE